MRTVEYVPVDNQLLEDIRYINQERPVAFYHVEIREGEENKIPWHWHPVMQLIRVKQGEVRFFVGNMMFKLKSGDGILVNVNQLHRYCPEEKNEVRIISTLFLPDFIAAPGSSVYKTYVEPFLRDESHPCVVLRQETDWQEEMLTLFEKAFSIEESEKKEIAYEMEVHEIMSRFWRELLRHMDQIPSWKVNSRKMTSQVRIKQMLNFIGENYSEKIGLEDIAAAACISKREALRCFRENMWKTPILFLTEYRIEKAKEELLYGNKTILDIALSCGFDSASYFNRVFRKMTGMTPMEYRNHMK